MDQTIKDQFEDIVTRFVNKEISAVRADEELEPLRAENHARKKKIMKGWERPLATNLLNEYLKDKISRTDYVERKYRLYGDDPNFQENFEDVLVAIASANPARKPKKTRTEQEVRESLVEKGIL